MKRPVIGNMWNFEKAHDYSERATAIRQREGDLFGLQATLGSIGSIYVLEGSAHRAIPYYQRALFAAKQLNAPSYASAWEANLAEAFVESGAWESAAAVINRAQQDGFHEEQDRVSVLLTEADVSIARRDFTGAQRYLTQVIESAPSNAAQLWEAHAGLVRKPLRSNRSKRQGQSTLCNSHTTDGEDAIRGVSG